MDVARVAPESVCPSCVGGSAYTRVARASARAWPLTLRRRQGLLHHLVHTVQQAAHLPDTRPRAPAAAAAAAAPAAAALTLSQLRLAHARMSVHMLSHLLACAEVRVRLPLPLQPPSVQLVCPPPSLWREAQALAAREVEHVRSGGALMPGAVSVPSSEDSALPHSAPLAAVAAPAVGAAAGARHAAIGEELAVQRLNGGAELSPLRPLLPAVLEWVGDEADNGITRTLQLPAAVQCVLVQAAPLHLEHGGRAVRWWLPLRVAVQ